MNEPMTIGWMFPYVTFNFISYLVATMRSNPECLGKNYRIQLNTLQYLMYKSFEAAHLINGMIVVMMDNLSL